jgi:hypothetical protein
MIVRRRPQDMGTETEFIMAMDRVDFVILHELVRQQIKAFELIPNDSAVRGFYAILRTMDHAMVQAVPGEWPNARDIIAAL